MQIAKLSISPPVIMAPMAGVTDAPFRQVLRRLGCPAVVTEMVSSEGIVRRGKGSLDLLRFERQERPLIAQLFGSKPEVMAQAARACLDSGFDAIDLNMGCPVKKVVKNGAGAALMRDPERATAIVAAVRRACDLPLTVKLRSGWSAGEINAVELGRRLEQEGVDAITLHPRPRAAFLSGPADWNLIAGLVDAVEVPVIGNGDLAMPEDGRRMMTETGCAGVMPGRAAMGNPWLPGAMADVLAGREPAGYPPSPDERREVFCIHLQKMIDWLGSERRAVLRMRKQLVWYIRGLDKAAGLRRKLFRIDTAEEMTAALRDLVDGQQAGAQGRDPQKERSEQTCH